MARATPPPGLPVLRPFPSSTRAAAITPAEPVGARVARFPTAVSLPRLPAGSASASFVSRPARRSLALQPAWSLNRPRRPFVIGVLQPMSLPPSSAPTATGWSDSCRAGFAPAEEWRLVTAPQKTRLSDVVTDLDNHLSGGLHRPEGQSRLICSTSMKEQLSSLAAAQQPSGIKA